MSKLDSLKYTLKLLDLEDSGMREKDVKEMLKKNGFENVVVD
jgi:hypothetical protein